MSGHSHAKTIKHDKNITDQKRGKTFSKIARLISVAAKEKGANPETNPKLRIAIETARTANMPRENVDRAIKKGTGEDISAESLEEVTFEAFGPGGIAVIVEGITDNKNRALGEVKQVLNQYGGKMAGEGAVRWMFEKKGWLAIDLDSQTDELKNKEALEMASIESGAQDIHWRDGILDVYAEVEDFEKVKKGLEEKGIAVDSASLDWVPKEEVVLEEREKESCQKLFDALDDSDSVQGVFSNLKS
ncbi:MAG: YebC/PmpR family DNA-binding transcriptional regulator [bacterium]|nr:YebC/PmpR family DNA-binding transcriptional regulator [bacterium]